MSESLLAGRSERLQSLDAFRGITIAGMILVNHPGSWGQIYKPLAHVNWYGWTPTDLVFPFFLFIMGVAMPFSFDKRLAAGQSRLRLFEQVVRRAILLILLGLIMRGFRFSTTDGSVLPHSLRLIAPYVLTMVGIGLLFKDEPPLGRGATPRQRAFKIAAWATLLAAVLWFVLDFSTFQASQIRVPGVLQRIGLCYFFASLIMMFFATRGRLAWAAALIIGYWLIIKLIQAPAAYHDMIERARAALALNPEAWKTDSLVDLCRHSVNVPSDRPDGMLADWIDIRLFGAHIYSDRPDPEGLLSTIPSIATTLLGVVTGTWLRTPRTSWEKAAGMFLIGNALLFVGICMDPFFPIGKKLWTSSFVVFTAGMGLQCLAMCYVLIDILGWRKWAWPFLVYGTNAILVYFAAHMFSKSMGLVRWETAAGKTWSLYSWTYQNAFASWAGPLNGSLAFAIFYVSLWFLLLIPLYRRKIFLKI